MARVFIKERKTSRPLATTIYISTTAAAAAGRTSCAAAHAPAAGQRFLIDKSTEEGRHPLSCHSPSLFSSSLPSFLFSSFLSLYRPLLLVNNTADSRRSIERLMNRRPACAKGPKGLPSWQLGLLPPPPPLKIRVTYLYILL